MIKIDFINSFNNTISALLSKKTPFSEKPGRECPIELLKQQMDSFLHSSSDARLLIETFMSKWENQIETLKSGSQWKKIKEHAHHLAGSEQKELCTTWHAFREDYIELCRGLLNIYFLKWSNQPCAPTLCYKGTPGFDSDLDVTIGVENSANGSLTEIQLMQTKMICERVFKELTGQLTGPAIDLEFYVGHHAFYINEELFQSPEQLKMFNRAEWVSTLIQAYKSYVGADHTGGLTPNWHLFKKYLLESRPSNRDQLQRDFANVESCFREFNHSKNRFLYEAWVNQNNREFTLSSDESIAAFIDKLRNDPSEKQAIEWDTYRFRTECALSISKKLEKFYSVIQENRTRAATTRTQKIRQIFVENADNAIAAFQILSALRITLCFDGGCNTVGFLQAIVEKKGGQESERRYEKWLENVQTSQFALRESLEELGDPTLSNSFFASLESLTFTNTLLTNTQDYKADLAKFIYSAKALERTYSHAVQTMIKASQQAPFTKSEKELFDKLIHTHKTLQDVLRVKRNKFVHPEHAIEFLEHYLQLQRAKLAKIQESFKLPQKKAVERSSSGDVSSGRSYSTHMNELDAIDRTSISMLFVDKLKQQFKEFQLLETPDQKVLFDDLSMRIQNNFSKQNTLEKSWEDALQIVQEELNVENLEYFKRRLQDIVTEKPDGFIELSSEEVMGLFKGKVPYNQTHDSFWDSAIYPILNVIVGSKLDTPESTRIKQWSKERLEHALQFTDAAHFSAWKNEALSQYGQFISWADSKQELLPISKSTGKYLDPHLLLKNALQEVI